MIKNGERIRIWKEAVADCLKVHLLIKRLRKPVTRACIPAEIRNWYPPNTSLELCCYAILFSSQLETIWEIRHRWEIGRYCSLSLKGSEVWEWV
jgi:hypothetical protein